MADLSQSAFRKVLLRSVSMVGLAVIAVTLPQAVDDPSLKALIPLFVALIFFHFAPMFWASQPDVFSPPVLFGILSGASALSILASQLVVGTVRLDLIHGLDADQMSQLAQKVLIASILGVCSYYAGYYADIGPRLRRKFPKVQGLVWNFDRIKLVSAVGFGIFLVAFAVFQQRSGGGLFDVTNLAAGKRVWHNNQSLSWMVRGIQIGFMPLLLYVAWSAGRPGWRHFGPALAAILLMSLLVLRLGQRGTSGSVLLTVLVMIHYQRRRIPAMLFLGMLFFAVLASNVLYIYRTNPDQAQQSSVLSNVKPTAVLADMEGERQRFSVLALVMKEFPENHAYLLGESWVGLIATPIPRWLWPEKSEHFKWRDTGIVNQLGGGPRPTPFLGVLYVNFSWIGIVLGWFLWGIFHRALYEWMLDDSRDVNVTMMYAFIMIHFGPSLLQISEAVQYILPLWVMLKFIGRKREAEQPVAMVQAARI